MTYIGRNGLGKMYGLEMYDAKSLSGVPFVYLNPINSRGAAANCNMRIPVDAIPGLVEILNRFYEGCHNADLSSR